MKYLFYLSTIASFFYSTVSAQPGSIDSSFGINGVVASNIGQLPATLLKLTVQNEQKILFANNIGSTTVAVFRYLPDGIPDSSFGINGKIESNDFGLTSAISTQKDGKILVGGSIFKEAGEFPSYKIIFRRFFSNGTVDSSFGENGTVISVLGGLQQTVSDMILQEDGKILIVGRFSEFGNRYDILLACYMPDGSLDSSFGSENGKTRIELNFGANAISFQKDGKIVIAGGSEGTSNSSRFLLARFSANGIIDSSFGEMGTGIVKTDYDRDGDFIKDMVIQPDDKIVVVGTALWGGFGNKIPYIAFARYLKDGNLDPAFGESGKVKLQLPERSEGLGLGLQLNDKIVVSGYTSFLNSNYVLARYLSDGTPDLEFGENGVSVTDFGATDEKAGEMIISLQAAL